MEEFIMKLRYVAYVLLGLITVAPVMSVTKGASSENSSYYWNVKGDGLIKLGLAAFYSLMCFNASQKLISMRHNDDHVLPLAVLTAKVGLSCLFYIGIYSYRDFEEVYSYNLSEKS